MSKLNFHVFVGSEAGLLKGVDLEKNLFKNLNFSSTLSRDDEITSMCWKDGVQEKLYFGQKDQTVKVYDSGSRSIESSGKLLVGEGPIKDLNCYNGNILTAVESGIVKLWNEDFSLGTEINTGGNLCKMTHSPFLDNEIATGGEENDLKVWDLKNSQEPTFKAKNVRNDFLDLRVPVWIMDIKFKSDREIITCTRHHQVRLYDTRAQKRPVIDMEFEKYPLMCLSLSHNENQVIVGSSRGRMALIDLRRKLLVHVFKGFAGSIRSVICHPQSPLVASCGLDRFLRIHDLNKHKLLKKVYLKTRLNCLLLKDSASGAVSEQIPKPVPKEDALVEEDENLWMSMQVVDDKTMRKKSLSKDEPGRKKLKMHLR